jgi:N-acetylmuramoyl-L-alanine amidase
VAEPEISGSDPPQGNPARDVGRHLAVTAGIAALLATVLTAWRPASLDPAELVGQLLAAEVPAAAPVEGSTPEVLERQPIGIVAGHSGLNRYSGLPDPGAVCDDGLTELQVNTAVAELVIRGLEGAGLDSVLLEEWDPRLNGFRGLALISIHADSCQPINETATGFKIAAALDTAVPDKAQRLVACVADRYGRATGMRFHPNSVTLDMTEYHSFREIHSQTPAAIIEVGFLFLDRGFLTRNPDLAARGIVEGLLCYVNNEPATLPLEAPPQ